MRADFTNDLHIGFSASDGHNDKKWEIVIGGWNGGASVIRSQNQGRNFITQTHTKAEFDGFKYNLQVKKINRIFCLYKDLSLSSQDFLINNISLATSSVY